MAADAKALMLSALVKKVYKGKSNLADLFSEKIALVEWTLPKKDLKRGNTLKSWIASIHFSWIEPVLHKVAKELYPYVAVALSKEQLEKLQIKPAELSPAVVNFFERWFYEQLSGPAILPYSLLPPTPLDKLFSFSQARVVHLIDLLGIQDLSIDFKKILDRSVQEKIRQHLSPLQIQYLDYCLKEILVPLQEAKPASFWLENKKPRVIIHSAGLWRLTRLVAAEEKSWQWYFCHFLDRPRGEQMQKWIEQDKEIALQGKSKDLVLAQVLRLAEALK